MLGPGMRIFQGKPPVFAPANHSEGGGGKVELGPGEAGDAAKWY